MTRARWPFLVALFVALDVAALCVVANAFGGAGIGYPNTLRYDFWQGRTSGNNLTIGNTAALLKANQDVNAQYISFNGLVQIGADKSNTVGAHAFELLQNIALTDPAAVLLDLKAANVEKVAIGYGGNSDIRGALNSDFTVGQQGTAKMVLHFPTGDGAGGNADRFTLDSTAIHLANGTTIAGDPRTYYLSLYAGASASATTIDTAKFNTQANSFAPAFCSFTVEAAGTGAGSCTYALYDSTQATALCSMNLGCAQVSGTQISATCSGTAAVNDGVDFRRTAPASNTTATGNLVCSYTKP